MGSCQSCRFRREEGVWCCSVFEPVLLISCRGARVSVIKKSPGLQRWWWCILRTGSKLLMDDTQNTSGGPLLHEANFPQELWHWNHHLNCNTIQRPCDREVRLRKTTVNDVPAWPRVADALRVKFVRWNCWAVFALTDSTALGAEWGFKAFTQSEMEEKKLLLFSYSSPISQSKQNQKWKILHIQHHRQQTAKVLYSKPAETSTETQTTQFLA